MKRAALYMRISTKNHGQTTETQAIALHEYAARRGLQIANSIEMKGSAVPRTHGQLSINS